jgi:hypothetical protein
LAFFLLAAPIPLPSFGFLAYSKNGNVNQLCGLLFITNKQSLKQFSCFMSFSYDYATLILIVASKQVDKVKVISILIFTLNKTLTLDRQLLLFTLHLCSGCHISSPVTFNMLLVSLMQFSVYCNLQIKKILFCIVWILDSSYRVEGFIKHCTVHCSLFKTSEETSGMIPQYWIWVWGSQCYFAVFVWKKIKPSMHL